MMHSKLETTINSLELSSISEDRKSVLQPLIDYIQTKVDKNQGIRLNFICTHNSRRSHLSQIWAQTLAYHYEIKNVFCYSGGTEATALFPVIAETLELSGFMVEPLSEGDNPIYSIKYAANEPPIIGFSKTYNSKFNPNTDFAAILTCNHADENCPVVEGAEERISITYEDPKISDGTPQQKSVYQERSLQIATEMKYVFSKINNA